jgi:hypothetical protein
MKARLFLVVLSFLLICIDHAIAQDPNVIIIKAGEEVSSARKHFFQYPEFIYGKVLFDNGDSAKCRMNYNFALGAIQFIRSNGDTLSIANESDVQWIAIKKDTFLINDQQYFEVVNSYPFGKLLKKQILRLSDEHKSGAYGISSPTHNIETKQTLIAEQTLKLLLNRDLILTKEKQYYLLSSSGKLVPVNKKHIIQVFPNRKNSIDNYLKENDINFRREQDLLQLFTYLVYQ